jgi:hypothetical protein
VLVSCTTVCCQRKSWHNTKTVKKNFVGKQSFQLPCCGTNISRFSVLLLVIFLYSFGLFCSVQIMLNEGQNYVQESSFFHSSINLLNLKRISYQNIKTDWKRSIYLKWNTKFQTDYQWLVLKNLHRYASLSFLSYQTIIHCLNDFCVFLYVPYMLDYTC